MTKNTGLFNLNSFLFFVFVFGIQYFLNSRLIDEQKVSKNGLKSV